MSRLCERPGCSRSAEVSYVLDAAAAFVRLDPFDPAGERGFSAGVLCRRHADAMVVPRGWALDDRREATPRLFQPRTVGTEKSETTIPKSTRHPAAARPRPRRSAPVAVALEPSLPFDPPRPAEVAAEPVQAGLHDPDALHDQDALDDQDAVNDQDATAVLAWTPDFAAAEDIDEMRGARSPLLSRAFRGLHPSG